MKSTCSKCGGIDAYGLSPNRPEHLKKELCSECHGFKFIGLKPCPKCNGKRDVKMNKDLMDFVETKLNSINPMSIEEFIEAIKIIGLDNLTLEEINEAIRMVKKHSIELTGEIKSE